MNVLDVYQKFKSYLIIWSKSHKLKKKKKGREEIETK